MNFELLRIVVALIGTAILAYQDQKTSFIDEKIAYAMIASGLLFNILTFNFDFILFAVGGAVLIAAIGYFIYKQGQFGAGDILLFCALQLLLPFAPLGVAKVANIAPYINTTIYLQVAQMFPFFFSIFITSSVLALVGSSAMYGYKLYKLKIKWKPDYISLIVLTLAGVIFVYWFGIIEGIVQIHSASIIILAITMAATVFSTSMKEQIMNNVIVRRIAIKQIEDEDILATEKMDKKLVEKYKLIRVLTAENAAKLKKIQIEKRIKLFPVYKNLPRFVPYILMGLILSLLLISPVACILFD
ncbi:MAG: prepilin peptidase [Candidatus Micrarchaeota archaeon]